MKVDKDIMRVMRVGTWLSPQNKKDFVESIFMFALLLFLGAMLFFLCLVFG